MLIVLPALLEAHHDEVRMALQEAGGEAGDGVGLVDGGGDAPLRRRADHGIAGVASGAHHQVRRERLQNGPGLGRGAQEVLYCDQIVLQLPGCEGAVEAGDLHRPEGPPRALDELLLNAPAGPHEEDLAVRLSFFDKSRQGQSGVHVSRRAAAGEYDLHRWSLFSTTPLARGSAVRPRGRRPPPPAG